VAIIAHAAPRASYLAWRFERPPEVAAKIIPLADPALNATGMFLDVRKNAFF
jgi:hypothetical protein